ncbi:MAG: hypothetical protein R3D25_03510 [Geminicoccaceae bacterium]
MKETSRTTPDWVTPSTSSAGGRHGVAGREQVLDLAADHERDQRIDGDFLAWPAADQMAVAQHLDGVADAQHVAQDVADVDEGDAQRAQPLHDGEELLGLASGERGGRLVEQDDAGVLAQRLGDLDELPLALAEPADRCRRRVVHVDHVEQLAGALADAAPIDQRQPAEAPGEAADEDVLLDREVLEEVELLVDEGEAGLLGVARPGRPVGPAVEGDAAAIRLVDAAQDVHGRRLARAVLADEAEDLALAQGEAHAVQHLDAEEALREAVEAEDLVRHRP